MKKKKSKTTRFLMFLIEIGVFPIGFTDDKIYMKKLKSFLMISVSFGIYFFGIWNLYEYAKAQDEEESELMNFESGSSRSSVIVLFFVGILMNFFNLTISHGLKNLQPKFFQTSFSFPKWCKKFLIFYVFDLVTKICNPKLLTNGNIKFYLTTTASFPFLLFGFTIFLILCLLNQFQESVSTSYESFTRKCCDAFKYYKQLEKVLEKFFLLFYGKLQIICIFYVYTSFSTLSYLSSSSSSEISLSTIFHIIFILVDLSFYIFTLCIMTDAVSSVFETIYNLRMQLYEKIRLVKKIKKK